MIDVIGGARPLFALRAGRAMLVLHVTPEGLLGQAHWGAMMARPTDALAYVRRTHRDGAAMHEAARDLPLTEFAQAYPVAGASDYRHCALDAEAGGLAASTLRYRGHAVTDGRPDMDGLPGADGAGARTLTVEMADAPTGLACDLRYTVWDDQDAVAMSVRLRNESRAPIVLRRALSACLALPPGRYEALHLHGTWAHEFQAERVPLPSAQLVLESTRGASSAAHHPFLAILSEGADEVSGEAHAVALAYSGDHRHTAERGEFGDVRLSAGIGPSGFAWRLDPGEAFTAPEAVCAWSGEGLGGMSRAYHRFVREKVTPARWRGAARPTYLNTWEAAYFDVDEAKVLRLADRAAGLGAQMLVLDDGWFRGRTSDRTGLGAWEADPARFPSGIADLAAKVRAKGLRFGLWVEPEMVSPDHALAAERPDWVLAAPGRTPSLGRHQLALDLGNPDVRAHLFGQLDALLACGDIGYVKWDMNRPMTDAWSAVLPPGRQREAPHRYMLGLYALLDRLTKAYPDVLFEACASGGARMDMGLLRWCAQGWPSDMVDPVGRAAILSGASLIYPMDVMAAYVGPSPNHQNGRATGLDARARAGALCAAQGLSLNEADLDADAGALRAVLANAREGAAQRMNARFDRLAWSANETVWQLTSADGARVDVIDIHVLSRPNAPNRRARLRGLDPDARYEAQGRIHGGDALMGAGLPLGRAGLNQTGLGAGDPGLPPGDFATAHWRLTRVQ